MDAETKEMFQLILSRMDGMETRFDEKLQQQKEDLTNAMLQQKEDLMEVMQQQAETLTGMIGSSQRGMEARIQESQRETMVFVENSVGKRIDSLFDGYKLTHEKQWELERRMESLEKRLSDLEHKAG